MYVTLLIAIAIGILYLLRQCREAYQTRDLIPLTLTIAMTMLTVGSFTTILTVGGFSGTRQENLISNTFQFDPIYWH